MTDMDRRAREIAAGLAESICRHADFFCEVCNENSTHCRCTEHVRVRAERAITEGLTIALRAVEAETREACAKTCDALANDLRKSEYHEMLDEGCYLNAAAAIRATRKQG